MTVHQTLGYAPVTVKGIARGGLHPPACRRTGACLASQRMKLFQLDFNWLRPRSQPERASDVIEIDSNPVPILYQRNERAKRYRLFIDRQGRARVTIPRRGSRKEAQLFASRHQRWLADKLAQFTARRERNCRWRAGTEILFRGETLRLEVQAQAAGWRVSAGPERIAVPFPEADLRPAIESHLRQLAAKELPPRVLELAAQHGCVVRKVTVRNQVSRWGSCSRRGTISLNWRLVQVPVEVRDYIILHELMHLREMNHSRRFWALVEQVCPGFRRAEAWLRLHGPTLL